MKEGWKPLAAAATASLLAFERLLYLYWRLKPKSLAAWMDGRPWYSRQSIDFIWRLDLINKRVLQFGGRQSTVWWAHRAASVLSIKQDARWAWDLAVAVPGNVEAIHVGSATAEEYRANVKRALEHSGQFDLVVIGGHFQEVLPDIAIAALAKNGAIICDNASGFGFFNAMKDHGLPRVDDFWCPPRVVNPSSIWFGERCFLFA